MTADPSPVAGAAADPERPRPHLRLVTVPTPQPPLEPGPVRLVLPGVVPPRPPHRPGPRPEPRTRTATVDADFGPRWTPRADLPDPRDAGRRVLTTTLEALAGRRPIGQVGPLVAPGVFAALAGGRRPRWCREGNAPIVVGPVHVCEPVDGVAEVSAVARRAGRAHAVAARLEGIDGRWRCTAVQIG
jgi:Family of unknown function (DUF6459)